MLRRQAAASTRPAQPPQGKHRRAHLRGALVGSITQAEASKSSRLSHSCWCCAKAASNCRNTAPRPLPPPPGGQHSSKAVGRSAPAMGAAAG